MTTLRDKGSLVCSWAEPSSNQRRRRSRSRSRHVNVLAESVYDATSERCYLGGEKDAGGSSCISGRTAGTCLATSSSIQVADLVGTKASSSQTPLDTDSGVIATGSYGDPISTNKDPFTGPSTPSTPINSTDQSAINAAVTTKEKHKHAPPSPRTVCFDEVLVAGAGPTPPPSSSCMENHQTGTTENHTNTERKVSPADSGMYSVQSSRDSIVPGHVVNTSRTTSTSSTTNSVISLDQNVVISIDLDGET